MTTSVKLIRENAKEWGKEAKVLKNSQATSLYGAVIITNQEAEIL